jgi:hypothetical protein
LAKREVQKKEAVALVLEQVVRTGACQMPQAGIENEVAEYLERYRRMTYEKGCRLGVRNGYLPGRELITAIGCHSDEATSCGLPEAEAKRP